MKCIEVGRDHMKNMKNKNNLKLKVVFFK